MEHHERQDRNHRTHVRSRQPRAGHRIPERTGRCVRNVLGRAGVIWQEGQAMATEYLGVKQVAERLGITSGGLLNLKLPDARRHDRAHARLVA